MPTFFNVIVKWARHGRRRRISSVERRPPTVGIRDEDDVAGISTKFGRIPLLITSEPNDGFEATTLRNDCNLLVLQAGY
jgi:hypothetical protein